MNLDNKGQTLVLFVLLIPVMIIVMILVIDMGNLFNEKKKLDNIGKIATRYGLEHYSDSNIENDIINLVKENDNDIINIDISISNNIEINLNKEINGIFGKIINKNIYKVNSNYIGYISDKKIKRIK